MKTLEQIKDEVAKGIGYSDYEGMASVTFGVANKVIRSLIDEVSKMYAQQVAEKALADAAENAKLVLRQYNELGEVSEGDLGQEITTENDKEYVGINKDSILNTKIILP